MENNNFDDEKKTILIVDDEQKIVDLLVHNLTREGYNTIEANDGQTAIDLAISQRPDLILLDVMIPRVDGLTVCKKIKNYYFLSLFFILKHILLSFLSAYPHPAALTHAHSFPPLCSLPHHPKKHWPSLL